jgi:hypothetical protein
MTQGVFDTHALTGGGRRRKRKTVGRKPKRQGTKRVGGKGRSRSRSGGFDSGVLVPAALLGALQLYKRRASNKSSKKMSRRRRRR